jgi:serine/threonine protein kinase
MQSLFNQRSMLESSYYLRYRVPTSVSTSLVAKRLARYESGDLISFLAVAHCHGLAISALTWELSLGSIGQGATADIRQTLVNLEYSLAFKLPAPPTPTIKLSQEYRVLMSEIHTLCSAYTRNHPNIVLLEGIAWNFQLGDAWPVLMFEKAHNGDLRDFLNSQPGRILSTWQRITLCQDIATGLRCLHSNGI